MYIFPCTACTGPFDPNLVTKRCYKSVHDVQALLLPISTFGGTGHLHTSQEVFPLPWPALAQVLTVVEVTAAPTSLPTLP